MPPLPHGLVKREVKTKGGTRTVYYWRRQVNGTDQRISLGRDRDVALTRFRELQESPPPLPSRDPGPEPEAAVTVESFTRRWLAEYAASHRHPRGCAQAEQRFRDYLWPLLGQAPLSALKPADIQGLSAGLGARGVGLVTRRRTLEDLRCALRYAVEQAEVLTASPWRRGMLPRLPEAAPRALNELELAEAMRVTPERWKPALLLLAHTGLRWGEARALRWEDVRGTPYAHLVVSRSHSGATKSRKVREVPLLPEAESVLETLAAEAGPERHGRVFPWLPETASWIRRYVRGRSRLRSLAETFHVHTLRHTFASRWLERGGTIETLQKVLGHSTVTLTERYGRLRPWAVAAEARRVADAGTVVGTVAGSEEPRARKLLQGW